MLVYVIVINSLFYLVEFQRTDHVCCPIRLAFSFLNRIEKEAKVILFLCKLRTKDSIKRIVLGNN